MSNIKKLFLGLSLDRCLVEFPLLFFLSLLMLFDEIEDLAIFSRR